jgi:hypothetical protein
MPADVSGTVDMEEETAANRPYWLAMIGGAVRMLFPTPFFGLSRISRYTGTIIAAAVVLLLLATIFVAFWP